MDVYKILKYKRYIKNYRLKNFGIFLLHLLNRRYLAVYFDPILTCNLRCQMCYFSNEEKRKTMKGIFPSENLPLLANAFFHRALKLQIGCGAEPSLYKNNVDIIRFAKLKNVPYISMTSNGNLLDKETLRSYLDAGLDEITLSMHGVIKETYEHLMVNASYEKYHEMLKAYTELKKEFPNTRLRINYTINSDNILELIHFFDLYGKYAIDIIQLRPIQKIGESQYNNFSLNDIISNYNNTIQFIIDGCKTNGITCMAPTLKSLTTPSNTDNLVYEATYCYINPRYIWRNDFNLNSDTIETYSKRTQLSKKLFLSIFRSKKDHLSGINNLNYSIS